MLKYLIYWQIKMKLKTTTKHILCDFKCKFNRTACNWNQNGIIKHVNGNVKIKVSAKKIIVEILPHVFARVTII